MIKTAVIVFLFIPLLTNGAVGEHDNERSTRGSALGYGFSALADEPAGVFFNPAGIGFLEGYQVASMVNRISRYNLPSIDESPSSGLFGVCMGGGRFGKVAVHAYRRGSFTENTLMTTTNELTLTYSRCLNPQLSAGINYKYTFETNYARHEGWDIDIGAIYKVNDIVNLGFVAENALRRKLTSEIYGDGRYPDRMFRIALSYVTEDPVEPTAFVFALGVKQQYAGDTVTACSMGSFGVEQWFRNDMPFSVALRACYTTTRGYERNLEQISFGWSLRFHNRKRFWRLDYSYLKYPFEEEGVNLATGNHMVSIVFGIGGLLRIPIYD